MPTTFDELAALIRSQFADLSPQFQAGAAFLLDHPDEVAVSSMRKLAERAQIQPAALVRLAQQLGFEGWGGLRELFVARVRTRPEPLAARAKSLVARNRRDGLGADLLAAQQRNLSASAAHNAGVVFEAARVLRRAKRVHVAGFRSCYPVAFGLAYQYGLFRSTVMLLTGDAGTLELQLRAVDSDSATIVVSFAPYSVEAARVAQAALEQGSRLIAITDSAVSPIALNADKVLVFSHESPSFFPSLVAATATAELLVAQLLTLEGDAAVESLEQAEETLHARGAYVA